MNLDKGTKLQVATHHDGGQAYPLTNAQNRNWFSIHKIHHKPTLSAIPYTKRQQKTLTSSHTVSSGGNDADITALSFTNLDSTKTYKLTATLKMVTKDAGLGVSVRDAANGSGNILHTFYSFRDSDAGSSAPEHELAAGAMMLSGITSIYFHVFEITGNDEIIGGTGTTDQTKVILEELPMHTEIDIW